MKEFNQRMGKVQKFSKGGMIRKIAGRSYFDVGGATTLPGAATSPNVLTSTANAPISYATTNVSNLAAPVGQAAQGIASAFTAQNQYNAQLAPTIQSNYQPTIAAGSAAAANGYGQFNQNLAQEQALNGQLGQIAAGQGPNPAQTELAQNTQTNVANQAALMAGQRGASANAGLVARQAAQQGANTQQQAVGQAATTQAQQSLGALGQQAQLQQGIGSQITGEQNANTSLLGTGASAQNAQNNTNVSNYQQAQGINAQTAQQNANAVNQSTSGLLGGVGSFLGLADGGEVLGTPEPSAPTFATPTLSGPAQSGGAFAAITGKLKDSQDDEDAADSASTSASPMTATPANNFGAAPLSMPSFGGFARGGNVMPGPHGHVAAFLSSGGAVPAEVSAKERYLNPEEVRKVVHEGADPLKMGTVFKGKAKKAGNSLQNDTIPATLQEGGCVIPRSVTMMKGPHKSDKASLFVHRAVHMRKPQ